jgi:hypothetical protein
MRSVGYLLAAAAITLLGLLTYAASVASRLRAAREERARLRNRAP